MLTAFTAFGTVPGAYIAVGIIFLAGAAVTIWIRFFPRSGIGRRMTVATDMASFKGTQDGLRELVGHEGEAASNLRPGGFAVINGKRIDVVTQGEMVLRGSKVRVLRVEGNRVVVERVAPPQKT